MDTRATMLTLAAALTLTIPAGADECAISTSDPELTIDERYYVDNDLCQWDPLDVLPNDGTEPSDAYDSCLFSVWLYEESNGLDGLQRHDEVVDDTCGGVIKSDSFAS